MHASLLRKITRKASFIKKQKRRLCASTIKIKLLVRVRRL
nr:MAG TPA: hypothetical protein [Caudoviricetes sp.]